MEKVEIPGKVDFSHSFHWQESSFSKKPIESQVHGSCLGPLLFLIYINDIIDCFDDKVNCKLYADDVIM